MKSIKIITSMLLLCSTVYVVSCKKNDTTTSTTTSPSLSNKLEFIVKDLGGNVVANATLKTYTSTANRTTGSSLNTGSTDSNGSVTFSNFAAGTTYYYSVDASIGGSSKHAEGSATAAQNQTVSTTVQFTN